jgi:1,4-dihydroxy-2-naphthoyl-CoA hydrolase
MSPINITPEFLNYFGRNGLPGHLGIIVTRVSVGEIEAEFQVESSLLAPHGYLHAGSVVSLADTCAGFGSYSNLPEGASGFTTIELKSNHLGTARDGIVKCVAKALPFGKQHRYGMRRSVVRILEK